jgi:hypothetical protein
MRKSISFLALLSATALAACGGSMDSFTDVRLFPNAGNMFSSRDWGRAPTAAEISLTAKTTPEDYVDANGTCVSAPTAAAEPAAPGPNAAPLSTGGVGLGMTECQVVQRAGQPNSVDIGAENNARKAVLTYAGGTWPGIYTFVDGRLKIVDRIATPEPAKPVAKKRPAKPQTAAR